MKTTLENISTKEDGTSEMPPIQTVFDSPIIITNRLLLRCEVKNGTYIPTEIISFHKLISEMKEFKFDDMDEKMENRKTSVDSPRISQKQKVNRKFSLPSQQSNRKQSNSDDYSNPSSILLEYTPDAEKRQHKNSYLVDSQNLHTKYEEQINWVKQDETYVSMETVKTMDEFQILLDVIINCGLPIAVTIRANNDKSYTVLYQLIKNFREEFMVLPVGGKHCLFMEPF